MSFSGSHESNIINTTDIILNANENNNGGTHDTTSCNIGGGISLSIYPMAFLALSSGGFRALLALILEILRTSS